MCADYAINRASQRNKRIHHKVGDAYKQIHDENNHIIEKLLEANPHMTPIARVECRENIKHKCQRIAQNGKAVDDYIYRQRNKVFKELRQRCAVKVLNKPIPRIFKPPERLFEPVDGGLQSLFDIIYEVEQLLVNGRINKLISIKRVVCATATTRRRLI